MRVALDTNILLYADGMNDPIRQRIANETIESIPAEHLVIPAQVLAEFGFALRTKGRATPRTVREAVQRWADICLIPPTTREIILAATEVMVDHQIPLFDAIIIATASDSRCHQLLSEDLQHGFTWGGVTVINPFASQQPPYPTS